MKRVLVVALAAWAFTGCAGDDAGSEPTPGTDGSASSGAAVVIGTVTAPSDTTAELPPGAVLTVTLQDVSLADAAATVISTLTIDRDDIGFPVDFELAYEPDEIVDANTYSVSARVEASGDLLMISDTMTPVITGGAPTDDVEVALVVIADN